jgi:hypothetical protein
MPAAAFCEPIVYRKCGSLDFSQPYGPSRPLTGRALLIFTIYYYLVNFKSISYTASKEKGRLTWITSGYGIGRRRSWPISVRNSPERTEEDQRTSSPYSWQPKNIRSNSLLNKRLDIYHCTNLPSELHLWKQWLNKYCYILWVFTEPSKN